MRWIARGRGFAGTVAVGMLGACAAISGLGSYSTEDCPGECDASLGGANRTDGSSGGGNDVTQDQRSGLEIDALEDSESAASEDVEVADEPADAAEAADSSVVPDTGAFACNTSTGTSSCDAVTCSYTCNSNRQDCNHATAPDTDGCECAGTACCGTGCQTSHNSGLTTPATYYECSATGNTTQTQALAACTGSGGTGCSAKNTTCGGFFGLGGTPTSAACGTVAGTCYCWVYSGQNSGQVHTGGSGCNISCSSGSAWN
jgi:hypothetical protein